MRYFHYYLMKLNLVVIDPTVFNEMDDEFLYAFDIYLDKKGESELVYDFPDEEWNIVWNRETKSVQDFIESHKIQSNPDASQSCSLFPLQVFPKVKFYQLLFSVYNYRIMIDWTFIIKV